MRLLFLGYPHLALLLALGRPPAPDELVILGGLPWEPGVVLDRSAAAGRVGVRRGQPLAAAHALVPEARFLPIQPEPWSARVEEALERLGTLAPGVEGSTDPADPAFGRIFLGIEGLGRLWGAEDALARRAAALVAPALPGTPGLGVAGTRFGARTAAIVANGGRVPLPAAEGEGSPPPIGVIPSGGPATEAAWLAPLPAGLLTADPALRERLRVLGITRIGQVAALDRSAAIARFGAVGGILHDLARGLDGRPLRPRRPVERLRAEVELEPPVESVEPLRFLLRRLCGSLCTQLAARGAGVGRATLELHPEGRPLLRYEQPLPEPSAAPELLERLLAARLEAAPPSAPVAGLALELHGAVPAAGEQLGLFGGRPARAGGLGWQLAALAIRHGEGRILRARLLDPESAVAPGRFAWEPAVAGGSEG